MKITLELTDCEAADFERMAEQGSVNERRSVWVGMERNDDAGFWWKILRSIREAKAKRGYSDSWRRQHR